MVQCTEGLRFHHQRCDRRGSIRTFLGYQCGRFQVPGGKPEGYLRHRVRPSEQQQDSRYQRNRSRLIAPVEPDDKKHRGNPMLFLWHIFYYPSIVIWWTGTRTPSSPVHHPDSSSDNSPSGCWPGGSPPDTHKPRSR